MATEDLTWAFYSPENAYLYARDRIQGRWPPGEHLIAQDVHYAYRYAYDIIRDQFTEGEAVIAQNAEYAYRYALYVIRDRWPQAEAVIAQDPMLALDYYNRFKEYFTEQEKVFWLLKI